MPGYGESSKDPEHRVSLDVQGELLHDLLEHWELDAPHVIAHDYGGAVALRAHLLHGSRYASLALVDVVALAPWGSDFFRLVREHAEVFTAVPPAIHEGIVRAYIAGASHTGLTAEQADMLVAPWLGETGQAAFYRQIAEADQRLHRRDRAALPDDRSAGPGRVGHRGHLDPGRPRPPAREPDPRRAS